MKIIKVNFFTLYFLLILMLCGYLKIGLIIFFIVIGHELGHVVVASLLKYKIVSVTIYPFGGITKLEKDINTPINNEIIIALAGVLFQVVLGVIVLFFPFSYLTKNTFYKYNLSIMLFNMLPIIPLDGSIILKAILNRIWPFKKAYFITMIISLLGIAVYLIFNYWYSVNNYVIIFLFLFKTYDSFRNYKYIYNRFLLERYLNDYQFKFLSTKRGKLDILKLDTYQYFIDEGKIASEKKKLQEKFDKYS